MATSYRYTDAWSVSRQQCPSSTEQVSWDYATNMAIAKMWRAYDWRGTVGSFTPFWLVPGQQDYGKPFYSVPNDFFGLREAYLVNVGANSIPVRVPMRVVENLEATHIVSYPLVICYRPSISGFRTHPAAAYGASSPLYFIDGTYKTRPPKITRSLQDSLLLWDDVYFECFVQAIAWAALVAAGQRKAALEQEQVFHRLLAECTAVENLEDGEPTVHPNESLIPPGYESGLGWYPL